MPSSARLLSSIGPAVAQVTAPGAGVKLLVDRPDLAELAKRKQWPAPLTAMVRSIISEGVQKQTGADRVDRFLDLCFWLVRDSARVDPPELVEAMAADEEEHARAMAAWQVEFDAARQAIRDAAEGSPERAAALLAAEDLKATKPAPATTNTDRVLAEIDPTTLRRLFVDIEPDEGQLILLPPGDPRRPSEAERMYKFSSGDYFSVGPQILYHQEGGFGTFRT